MMTTSATRPTRPPGANGLWILAVPWKTRTMLGHDALGDNCAVAECAFPTAPWTPPQTAAPTGTTGNFLDAHLHDSTSRILSRRYGTDGRQLTDERRYAPMSAIHFTEMQIHLVRNTHEEPVS